MIFQSACSSALRMLVFSRCLSGVGPAVATEQPPVMVCTTVPSLGSLVRAIGGPEVDVFEFARGGDDPHFVDAKPSFVRRLHEAELLVLNGMELESGWLPVLIAQARNPRVQPGSSGYLDASAGVDALGVPTAEFDRSMGDVHVSGNPHYLLDPLEWLRVARMIHARLVQLRPQQVSGFHERLEQFEGDLARRLVGDVLAAEQPMTVIEKLARLQESGKLAAFAADKTLAIGGWLKAVQPLHALPVITDHDLWPYLARRCGLQVVMTLEPKPGLAPTSAHLLKVIAAVRAKDIKALLTSSYYDPRHASFVAEKTSIAVLPMAQEVGARDGTAGYLDMMDYNLKQLCGSVAAGASH